MEDSRAATVVFNFGCLLEFPGKILKLLMPGWSPHQEVGLPMEAPRLWDCALRVGVLALSAHRTV